MYVYIWMMSKHWKYVFAPTYTCLQRSSFQTYFGCGLHSKKIRKGKQAKISIAHTRFPREPPSHNWNIAGRTHLADGRISWFFWTVLNMLVGVLFFKFSFFFSFFFTLHYLVYSLFFFLSYWHSQVKCTLILVFD